MFEFFKKYRVHLKKNETINFPKKCVVCNGICINENKEVDGEYEYTPIWVLERWKRYLSPKPKIIIPIHKKCHEFWSKNQTKRNRILFSIVVFSSSFLYFIRREFDIWIFIIAMVSVLIADSVFNIFWYPEPFDFIEGDFKYKFVFGNKKFAKEFEDCNKNNLFDVGQLFTFKK